MSAAEPMAKPLPIAAVVLPSESSRSVIFTNLGTRVRHLRDAAGVVGDGPYESVDMTMPMVESIPTAEIAIP